MLVGATWTHFNYSNLLSVSRLSTTVIMRFATVFTLGITVVSTSASFVVRATVPRELLTLNQ